MMNIEDIKRKYWLISIFVLLIVASLLTSFIWMSNSIGQSQSQIIKPNLLYAIDHNGSVAVRLVSIDPYANPIAVQTVCNLNNEEKVNLVAIAFSPQGELVGVASSAEALYRITLPDCELDLIFKNNRFRWIPGIAFDRNGNLYGIDSSTNELVYIDIQSQSVTPIGPLNFSISGIGGLAVNFFTDELYAVVNDGTADWLLKIDKITGVATPIGTTGNNLDWTGAEFHPITLELFSIRGPIANVSALMKVDLNTGQETLLGTVDNVRAGNLAAPWPEITLHIYSVKVICDKEVINETFTTPNFGEQPFLLKETVLSTEVNIHNFRETPIRFLIKVVQANPLGSPKGNISEKIEVVLGNNEAVQVNCDNIRELLNVFPFEGFLVIEAPGELAVTAVYRMETQAKTIGGEIATAVSIDVEKIEPSILPTIKPQGEPPRPGRPERP